MTTTTRTSRSKPKTDAKLPIAPGSNPRNGNTSRDANGTRAVTDSTSRINSASVTKLSTDPGPIPLNGNKLHDADEAIAVEGDLLSMIIREAIAQHPGESAINIAEYVLRSKIHPGDIQRYFLQLLTQYVKDVHRNSANEARNNALRGGVSKSPKYKERQNLWQKMLDQTVIVNGVSKRYGDCTREDLIWRIEQKNILIGQIRNQIDNDQKIIELMDTHHVATVDGIPEDAAKS